MQDNTKSLIDQSESLKKKRKYRPSIAGDIWRVTINRQENMKAIRKRSKNNPIRSLLIKIMVEASRKSGFLTINEIVERMRAAIICNKLDIPLERIHYKTIYNHLKGSRERFEQGITDSDGHPSAKMIKKDGIEELAFMWFG